MPKGFGILIASRFDSFPFAGGRQPQILAGLLRVRNRHSLIKDPVGNREPLEFPWWCKSISLRAACQAPLSRFLRGGFLAGEGNRLSSPLALQAYHPSRRLSSGSFDFLAAGRNRLSFAAAHHLIRLPGRCQAPFGAARKLACRNRATRSGLPSAKSNRVRRACQ